MSLNLDHVRRYTLDPVSDRPSTASPVPDGLVEIRGVSNGFPTAARVPAGWREAERLARETAEHRRRQADRVRLVGMFDNPAADPAERAALARSLSRPTWPTRTLKESR